MLQNYTIQPLETGRLAEALALVKTVFMEFEAPEFSEEGIESFLKCIDRALVQGQMDSSELAVWTCRQNRKIVGVIGITARGHIRLLFVATKHHRRGIARALLQEGVKVFQEKDFSQLTVNSSPYAVSIYQHLGFGITQEEQCVNGIRFTPMTLCLTELEPH